MRRWQSQPAPVWRQRARRKSYLANIQRNRKSKAHSRARSHWLLTREIHDSLSPPLSIGIQFLTLLKKNKRITRGFPDQWIFSYVIFVFRVVTFAISVFRISSRGSEVLSLKKVLQILKLPTILWKRYYIVPLKNSGYAFNLYKYYYSRCHWIMTTAAVVVQLQQQTRLLKNETVRRRKSWGGGRWKTLISRNKGGVIDRKPERPFYISCNAPPPIDFTINFYLLDKKRLTPETTVYGGSKKLYLRQHRRPSREIILTFLYLYILQPALFLYYFDIFRVC